MELVVLILQWLVQVIKELKLRVMLLWETINLVQTPQLLLLLMLALIELVS